jgi:ribosomal protein S14
MKLLINWFSAKVGDKIYFTVKNLEKTLEKLRKNILTLEKKCFILKSIWRNSNIFTLIRWNAFVQLKLILKTFSKVLLSNRCIQTSNRKRFNKLTKFSRHIFLKHMRFGKIFGIQKSNW